MRCILLMSLFHWAASRFHTLNRTDFDPQDEEFLWGNGIPGFNPYGARGGTTDTGTVVVVVGMPMLTVFKGTYSVKNESIHPIMLTGLKSNCCDSGCGVQVGQGQQCLTDCANNVMLNFTGSVAGDGTVRDKLMTTTTMASQHLDGLFSSGIATGTISVPVHAQQSRWQLVIFQGFTLTKQ